MVASERQDWFNTVTQKAVETRDIFMAFGMNTGLGHQHRPQTQTWPLAVAWAGCPHGLRWQGRLLRSACYPLAEVPSDNHMVSGGSPDHRHWLDLCLVTRVRDINTETSGAAGPQIQPWLLTAAQAKISPWLLHICLLLTAVDSLVPYFSTEYGPLSFAFSPISPPCTPSFPSLHHTSSTGVAPEVDALVSITHCPSVC